MRSKEDLNSTQQFRLQQTPESTRSNNRNRGNNSRESSPYYANKGKSGIKSAKNLPLTPNHVYGYVDGLNLQIERNHNNSNDPEYTYDMADAAYANDNYKINTSYNKSPGHKKTKSITKTKEVPQIPKKRGSAKVDTNINKAQKSSTGTFGASSRFNGTKKDTKDKSHSKAHQNKLKNQESAKKKNVQENSNKKTENADSVTHEGKFETFRDLRENNSDAEINEEITETQKWIQMAKEKELQRMLIINQHNSNHKSLNESNEINSFANVDSYNEYNTL